MSLISSGLFFPVPLHQKKVGGNPVTSTLRRSLSARVVERQAGDASLAHIAFARRLDKNIQHSANPITKDVLDCDDGKSLPLPILSHHRAR
ncbi:hypothetical protein QUB70_17095, partial [Microcoleus sp. A003_D6]